MRAHGIENSLRTVSMSATPQLEYENRRRLPRYSTPKGLVALFRAGPCYVEGEIREISEEGIFFSVRDGGAAENEGIVTIKLPDGFLRARAAIRSVRPGEGFGMEFLEMSPEHQAVLINYCRRLQQATASTPN